MILQNIFSVNPMWCSLPAVPSIKYGDIKLMCLWNDILIESCISTFFYKISNIIL